MGSVTSWTRLEPRTRDARLTSVEARIADPLWLLGRQWQLGEFQGEDAGTPISAALEYASAPISRWAPSAPVPDGEPLPPDVPLDVLVEAETTSVPDGDGGLRAALEAGRRLLDLLGARAADHAGPLAAAYGALPPAAAAPADLEEERLRTMAAGRLPDARRLAPVLRTWRGGGPAPAGVDAADPGVVAAADAWLNWYAARPAGGQAPRTWRATRLEHEFSLAARTIGPGVTPAPASTETVLVASEHGGRDLDWHALDVWDEATMGALDDPHPPLHPSVTTPTLVSFPGMPAARWWQIEDGDVDLTALRPGPEDLGRLLFTEFAVNYGNDFFWLPLDLPTGSVTQVWSLRVTTSFGDVVSVPSTAEADRAAKRVRPGGQPWTMFTPTRRANGADTGAADLLVLLPLAGQPLHGEPLEDLLLSRDEMADVAWVLERAVPGPSGAPVDRYELWQRSRQDPEPQPGTPHRPALAYDLATDVPPFWLPLLNRPGPPGSDRSVVLELRALQNPIGTLLADGMVLDEERLTRSGIRLIRHRRRARGSDGTTYVWTARVVSTGTGESTSGLRFDVLTGE